MCQARESEQYPLGLINCLNTDIGEPFYGRITQQGMPSTSKTCLTIPALKDALRRSGLLGRAALSNTNYQLGALCGKNDSETLDRARSALNHYFGLIRNANLMEWESGRDGCICTNVAVQAYIMLLGAFVDYWESNTAADAHEMSVEDIMIEIEEYLRPLAEFLESSNAAQIKAAFQVPFGSGGPPSITSGSVGSSSRSIQISGHREWMSGRKSSRKSRISGADAKLKEIVSEMRNYIFDVFRTYYGEKNAAYWEKGVIDKNNQDGCL